MTKFLISINILDKNKLEKSQGFIKFNKAVEESVKTFQSQNRLRPTGIVDTNLVKLINKKIKEKNNSK
jgi:murein L,D-transpeptidase YcbB/YkuD